MQYRFSVSVFSDIKTGFSGLSDKHFQVSRFKILSINRSYRNDQKKNAAKICGGYNTQPQTELKLAEKIN